jgi:chemotaxis signal transduction protein
MAALTPVPDAPPGIVGLLNLGGTTLVAVDPRPRLDQPPATSHPDQRLIVMVAGTRYLLWVDAVEQIASVQAHDVDALDSTSAPMP